MLRSLFSGVSGLRGHQTMMDVVGNNIANVNTTGFKQSSVTFQDLLSQTLAGAGAANENVGGTNPAQVGLGSRVSAITTNFSQGALQVTGKSTDVAIQGDGFFVAETGGQRLYTRAGNLQFDANGNLQTPEGAYIQGWMADPITKEIVTTNPVTRLTMPPGQLIPPVKTNQITIGSKLSSEAAVGDTVTTAITAFNTQGEGNDINFVFTKTANNTWTVDSTDEFGAAAGSATLTFDPATGALATQTPATYTINPTPAANWPTGIEIDFNGTGKGAQPITEFGGQTSLTAFSQDGTAAGSLQSFSISSSGVVTGVFSNGTSQPVGQLALAIFNNPSGLEKSGNSMYRTSPNSGEPQVGTALGGGRGALAAGSIEMSNVDLSGEFTNLIIGQRGFQANSKVITTADQLLETLLQLKR